MSASSSSGRFALRELPAAAPDMRGRGSRPLDNKVARAGSDGSPAERAV